MTKSQNYLAENAQYIADKSQVEIIQSLTDEQFDALIEAGSEAGHGDDFGGMVKTHETLEDFEASRLNHWSQRGTAERIEVGTMPAVSFEDFQMVKGQPRRSCMVVVDCGDFRVAVQ